MSELRATTISDTAGTGPVTLTGQSAAKAWANFDGTGTISFYDSYNASSLTDSGTGDYEVNFTNNYSSGSYGRAGIGGISGDPCVLDSGTYASHSASATRIISRNDAGVSTDAVDVSSITHGDLA